MLKVITHPVNYLQVNDYLVYDTETRDAMLIDAGFQFSQEWQQMQEVIEREGLHLVMTLVTHCHFDHVMGLNYIVRAHEDCLLYGSPEEQQLLGSPNSQASDFGLRLDLPEVIIGNRLHEGQVLRLGSYDIHVLDCPGHSFHGFCFYIPDAQMIFTGDVLFYCSVGRSDFTELRGRDMGCNGQLLIEGIVQKLMTLPGDTVVYPGHGQKTKIKIEQSINPYF